jgi:hypothetical protein
MTLLDAFVRSIIYRRDRWGHWLEVGHDMKTKSKIWLGVGAFVVVGPGASAPLSAETSMAKVGEFRLTTDTAIPHTAGIMLAQHADHPKEAGEAGESQAIANLPPDLAFGVRIALLRGHLLIGDELVKQQQWNAALPHFLHPTEEIYGDIKDQLADYKVPPFDTALKTLADVVKRKKSADYAKALKAVNDALVPVDAAMKQKQADWPSFTTEAAIETLKTAANEYEGAIVRGMIAKPVEYQDARGFIWQAERMIESIAADLQKKDADALKQVRAGLADLKKVFPAAMPPRTPVKEHAAMLAIVARIELAAGKLM